MARGTQPIRPDDYYCACGQPALNGVICHECSQAKSCPARRDDRGQEGDKQ